MGGVFSSFRFGEKEEREEEIAAEELRASMAEKRRESLCNGSASNARVELGFSVSRCIVYGLHLEPIISPK